MPTEFRDYTKAEWLAKVEKDLKGKPLESLNWEVKGKTFTPFWHPEDASRHPPLLPANHQWKIGVSISTQELTEANQLALEALEGGANALWFNRNRPLSATDKAQLLAGIYLEIIECTIDEEETKSGTGNIALDLLKAANSPTSPPVFCLHSLPGYFETIAYFRAVRQCWQLIAVTQGHDTPCQLKAFLFAQSEDPNANKVSNTVNAMAAVLGGADTVFLQPSDRLGSTPFYRRIARNVLNLLQEESYLNQVADPAAGSYYIEALTDTFAQELWADFQEISSRKAG